MTPEQIEAERERFEAWAEKHTRMALVRFSDGGNYIDPRTKTSWDAWLARAQEADQCNTN